MLQLPCFHKVNHALNDGVFVIAVVLLFEVVFEEFGNELPPIRARLASVKFDEVVTRMVGLSRHQEHQHLSLRSVQLHAAPR